MPRAEIEHTPTRRKFLGHLAGGTAAVAVAAGVSSIAQAAPVTPTDAVNPDAELIALCAQFDEAERHIRRLSDIYGERDEDVPDEAYDWANERQEELLDLITAKQATTFAGFLAVGGTLGLFASDSIPFLDDNRNAGAWDGRLIAMIIGDLSRQGAKA